MTLKELKAHIASFPDGHVFDWSLSAPFSWRGLFEEVAFSLYNVPSTKEEALTKVDSAFRGFFTGYKGGSYKFDESTVVNFEDSQSNYTDGEYAVEKLFEVLGIDTSTKDLNLLLISKTFK